MSKYLLARINIHTNEVEFANLYDDLEVVTIVRDTMNQMSEKGILYVLYEVGAAS